MKRTFWLKVARILLLGYMGVLLMLAVLERFMVYPAPPATRGNWNAAQFGAVDVEFESGDGTQLHGWYFGHPAPKAHVLFCHGNGEHIGFMGDYLSDLSARLAVSVFVFDYRGYGRSQGKPFEQGILADAEAAHRWLADRNVLELGDVVLHGHSLGGGVAVHLASKLGSRALIVERTFHSMVELGAARFPWLPVRWVMRNQFPSAERIAQYDGPLLQLHGAADTLVPIESARKLFAASPSAKKSFLEEPTMSHNGPTPEAFYRQIKQLLESF